MFSPKSNNLSDAKGASSAPTRLSIYSDGASRNNPGEASVGVAIRDERGETIQTVSEYIGIATNNVAEYTALIRALETALPFCAIPVDFYLDSQLVVRQMSGEYKMRNPGLMPLFMKARRLYGQYQQGSISHIPREQNGEADALANAAIDNQRKKGIEYGH